MEINITENQLKLIEATADEVLFGGAAGGGKSYGQLIDAFLYALRYKKSSQLILRRSFPDLERSLIKTSLDIFPKSIGKYTSTNHRWKFKNASVIEFGYCDGEKDVFRYQGAEYDCIRFDELTQFSSEMYIYLISRLRGTNEYPKQIKSTANPGGIGHSWVKERFIDIGPAGREITLPLGSRIYIPSKVTDNKFLIKSDPKYIKRLENLSQKDKKALLFGDWDIYDGQYFDEFCRDIHVVKPFEISKHWNRYVTMDYGLDMLAVLFIAVDDKNHGYVYKEIYKPNLIISDAAKIITEYVGTEKITQYLAPPDLWNRRQETGRSVADIFLEAGINLSKTGNDRVSGWLSVKEWLKIRSDEFGKDTAGLLIFDNCKNLIRTLPALQYNNRNPSDTAREPHELTHLPDALRGFCSYYIQETTLPKMSEDIREVFGFKTITADVEVMTGRGQDIKII